jgi:hypothetical protein
MSLGGHRYESTGPKLNEVVSVQKVIQNVYNVPSAHRVADVHAPAPLNLLALV